MITNEHIAKWRKDIEAGAPDEINKKTMQAMLEICVLQAEIIMLLKEIAQEVFDELDGYSVVKLATKYKLEKVLESLETSQ